MDPRSADTAAGAAEIERLRDALRAVIDPEIGMNVVDVGLVYRIEAGADAVRVEMTMTSPSCPMGEMIVDDAVAALQAAAPGKQVQVDLVWSPPWEPSMMSDKARRHFDW